MKVRYHLPDFAGKFRFNLVFISMLKNCPHYFREGVEIASVYGVFPPSIWNGGRTQSGTCDKKFVKAVLDAFNSRGIPLRFTFTNPVLEKKHLHDDFCNMVMHLADNGLNEVIVMSPMLEDYIRKNYPNYKITSSTCKRITEPDALAEELERDYHIVVVDYDLNNKFDVLEKIPNKDKCELLVNACCEPGCPNRSEHYRRIGEHQIAFCNHIKKYPNKSFDASIVDNESTRATFSCEFMNRTILDIKELSTHISPDDIYEKYVPMGFSQFKIEGRTTGLLNLLETYMYYMIKPEYQTEARMMFLHNLNKNGVIMFNE